MAKTSIVQRNLKRQKTVAKYAKLRKELKAKSSNPHLGEEERQEAMERLQKLPRNASPIRLRRRCGITGRPRGVYRKFGLSRTKLREFAAAGCLPGVVKASW